MPGSTGVSTAIGATIVTGNPLGGLGSATFLLAMQSGHDVPVGGFVAKPQPVPSPYATAPNPSPYYAVPIPTLSSATTYDASYSYEVPSYVPPSCTVPITKSLGSFTTQ
jgi:hypothetical protein